jgi:hypothetical protein
MALEAVFQQLTAAFEALGEALQSLGLTVIEDRPAHDEVLPVERLGNLIDDLRGWAAEGLAAAARAQQAVANPLNSYRACQALGEANERFIQLEYKFLEEAASHETVGDLARFAREQGREWISWSGGVQQGLKACRGPLQALDTALLRAWGELCERLSTRSVSLIAIGQQISETTRNASARSTLDDVLRQPTT